MVLLYLILYIYIYVLGRLLTFVLISNRRGTCIYYLFFPMDVSIACFLSFVPFPSCFLVIEQNGTFDPVQCMPSIRKKKKHNPNILFFTNNR